MLRNQGWRTWFIALPIVLFVLGVAPAAAQAAYNMTITSTGTSNMSCVGTSSVVCTPTASGANLTVSTVDAYLTAGDSVSINTGSGGADLGDIDVESPIAAVGSGNLTFEPAGSTILSDDVTTGGSQTYDGGVSVDANLTLTGAGVTFGSTVVGPSDLTVDASGSTVTFGGDVGSYGSPLGGTLGVTAASIDLDGSIYTDGAQTYDGPVTLDTNLSVVGSGVTFESTLDSTTGGNAPYSLSVYPSGSTSTVTFDGMVGSVTPLSGLDVDSGTSAQLNTVAVTTNGGQSYQGPVTLGANTTLSTTGGGDSIAFSSTLDGAYSLTVSGPGPSSQLDFYGDVGGSTPLTSINATLTDHTGIGYYEEVTNPEIVTTGAQTYSSPVNVNTSSATFSSAGAINFDDTVSGNSLVKKGSGTLTFATSNQYLTSGTISADGGLIDFVNGGLGSDSIEINGGGLEWDPSGNTEDISSQITGIGSAGATFNTGGNNVTLAGILTGAGGVTKAGPGTLTLQGNDNYSGTTVVDGGTLAVTGGVTGSVSVEPSATLSCEGGTLDGTVANNGGTLNGAPGAPSGATATLSGATALVGFTPGSANCFPVSYDVTESDGAQSATSGTSTAFSNLPIASPQTFTVTATNPVGTSAASASSNAVTVPGPATVPGPPTASISSPINGATYTEGEAVPFTYSCTDGTGGPGISSCKGNDPSGTALNTDETGTFTLTVYSTSQDGQAGYATATYTVVSPPNKFVVKSVKVNKSRATVTLTLALPKASSGFVSGTTVVSEIVWGKQLVHVIKSSTGKSAVTVVLSLPKKDLAKAKRTRPKAKIEITFTPKLGRSYSLTRTSPAL